MKNTKKDSKKKVPQVKEYKFPVRLSYLIDDLKTRLEVEQEELLEVVSGKYSCTFYHKIFQRL